MIALFTFFNDSLHIPLGDFVKSSDTFCKIYHIQLDGYKIVKYDFFNGDCVKHIETTLGRFLNKFFSFSPGAITHICERVKSIIQIPGNFEILSGEDVTKAYYRENYFPGHYTLQRSCMRFKKCQSYFKIYEDSAQLLVMTPKNGHRIKGRALLWKDANGEYLMDRVYTSEPYIENQFYEYAKSKGWYILKQNLYVYNGNCQIWLDPHDEYKSTCCPTITVSVKEYDKYPYMDSLRYLNVDKTLISTHPFDAGYCLSQTDGTKLRYNGY